MENWQIFLDGDNIPIDHYFNDIQAKIQNIVQYVDVNELTLNVFNQSNMVFKYTSKRDAKMRICCCNTTNKNATDAQILYNTGIAVASGNKVIIISNDKIFKEIENKKNVIVLTHNLPDDYKKVKLRKNEIIRAINSIRGDIPSKDVYLCDLCDYFPNHNMSKIRDYINGLYDIRINTNDCVYIVK